MPDLRGTKALVGRYHELSGSRPMNISFPDRGRAVAADASSLAADIVLPAGAGVRDLRRPRATPPIRRLREPPFMTKTAPTRPPTSPRSLNEVS